MIDAYKKIDVGFDKVECVVHMADIHIRLTQRHVEYREVFEKIYEYTKATPRNTLIVVGGDVLHAKCDLSPEAVQLASEFLKNLADIRPTILIAGNHDCLLTNSNRLDSLSPIVDNLAHDKLFYFKKTGLYGVGNILFNNMSVFDDVTSFIDIKKISKKIKNEFDTTVALFHGGVHGSMTDLGYLIENKVAPRDFFDGHDIVMLGDIHKAQTFFIEKVITLEEAEEFGTSDVSDEWVVVDDAELDEGVMIRKNSPIFRYPSSVIQQNHGETLLNHGFSVWDVYKRTFDHVEVQNDYGYYTIEIHDGKLVTDISDMPSKPKLRVKCKESVATEVKRVIAEIRKTHTITDLVHMRIDGTDAKRQINAQTVANLNQISNTTYQNKLVGEFLKQKYTEMDDDTLAEIYKINNALNSNLSGDDQSKNLRWKPIEFKFSNMFSYGENNVIDFTKLTDVYGLFAANASGKSSLMDALCFTIFDKSARAFKAAHVINIQKMSFSGRFTFEINSTRYVIERKGLRDKKNNVKVDVNFFKLEDDKEVPLNAEARRSTNEIIRDYMGEYDDFVLTSLALQGNQGSFIDMGQTERKELLSQFIGLTLFDRLAAEASSQIKNISGAIKIFNKEDGTKRVMDMENNVQLYTSKLIDLTTQKENAAILIKKLEEELLIEQAKLVILQNVPDDIDELREEKSDVIKAITSDQQSIFTIQKELEDIKLEYTSLTDTLKQYAGIDLEEKFDLYTAAVKKLEKTDRELEKLRTLVREKLKKLDHLDKHEYDPNCTFCMNNIFVKDAIATRESLDADKETGKNLTLLAETDKKLVEELFPFVEKYETSKNLLGKKSKLSANISDTELLLNRKITAAEKNKNNLIKIDDLIRLYEKSEEIIITNKKIIDVIEKLTTNVENSKTAFDRLGIQYMDSYSKKVSLGDQIALIKSQIEKVEAAEQEHAAYQYYLTAIGKDGIPFQIITDVIPKIEQEVNNILSQIVEFGVSIETDGKNVNVLIKYEDRKWPLEMSSGMEKFICALALRVALINISNLPRPNFLVVDEGFGALDANNMAMVHALFDYLKTNFEFIVVISHLDAMRDMVDKQLEIKKENGFSKIDNTV